MRSAESRCTQIADGILILAFCAAISVPGLCALLSSSAPLVDPTERRTLAAAPVWDWHRLPQLPAEIDAYFNDRLGLRRALITVHNWCLWRCGTSPNPAVLIGRQDWLFHNGMGDMDDYAGKRPIPPPVLDRWRSHLEAHQKWLSERGIEYLFFVAPNKQTIHPEYLPASAGRQPSPHTNFDELVHLLKTTSQITWLDLRKPLQEAALTERLYFPQDSHWNDYGRRVAYREIIRSCRSRFSDSRIGPDLLFREEEELSQAGFDLRGMLGIPVLKQRQQVLKANGFALRTVTPMPLKNIPWPTPYLTVYENPHCTLRVLLVGDSFLWDGELKAWIAQHFSRTFSMPRVPGFNFAAFQKLVESEHPDLVIEECVERGIFQGFPE